jgi:hypothetical protein
MIPTWVRKGSLFLPGFGPTIAPGESPGSAARLRSRIHGAACESTMIPGLS